MSDLTSLIADELIALINSSPRSPRKDEIEELLSKHLMLETEVPAAADSSGYTTVVTMPIGNYGSVQPVVSGGQTVYVWGAGGGSGGATVPTNPVADPFRAIFDDIFKDVYYGSVYGCPAHTDGNHRWAYNVNLDAHTCPCGFRPVK